MSYQLRQLLSTAEIQNTVKRLANDISRAAESNPPPILIGILNASFIFMADLVREITIPIQIDFVRAKSYNIMTQQGQVKLDHITPVVYQQHVIVVDTIVDTGNTVSAVIQQLLRTGPTSLKVCALLHKPARMSEFLVQVDYLGITIPDKFVVGYGLDLDGKYRNLPDIYYVEG